MAILFGDGINDDTLAIQEMIDSGCCEVVLPAPKVCYIISKPIELPSDFRLVLPRFAQIRLKKGSDCVMLKNKTRVNKAHRTDIKLSDYVNEFDPDCESRNIEVVGGIWDCNNMEQRSNPILKPENFEGGYMGYGFLFYNVKNLTIKDLTIKDPVTFAVNIDKTSYFTVENITFDFNGGNPMNINMDGIHINGNCHYGCVKNIKGACHDDMVALNAEEGSCGPISHIDISGLYCENCHSAVRFLTVSSPVTDISVRDVHGTFWQYGIIFSKYYKGDVTGYFDSITIENICASKTYRPERYNGQRKYAFICFQNETKVYNIKLSGIYRKEFKVPDETIMIEEGGFVDNLVVENVATENHTDGEMKLFVNNGTVNKITASNIRGNGNYIEIK